MDKISKKGLTFDDVLLVPQRSEVLPVEIEMRTRLTKNISISIPLVSAPMDTVTEHQMAIALAQEGGIGIIHKNLTTEEQVEEISEVKRSESGVIVAPITLGQEEKIEDAVRLMEKYNISGIPITDKEEKLIGIITARDIRFEKNLDHRIRDKMTKREKLITAPVGTDIEKAKTILQEHKIEKLPIVDDNNNLKGLITLKDIRKSIRYPKASKDKSGCLLVGASVGVIATSDTQKRIEKIIQGAVDVIVVDSAHGHSKNVTDTIRWIKENYEIDVIAGNVVTEEGTYDLIEAGADAVKVGVGPGSICTTRVVSGVGVPQITAIADCAKVAKEADIPLIADGGIKCSGDITKALASGADSVMIGGMFAATEESPGETIIYEGRSFKIYHGMGSLEAMKRGSKDRYAQANVRDTSKLVPEGVEGMVPNRGRLANVVYQLIGGVRSGMGYCGASDVKELHEKAKFIEISSASIKESHPHNVKITKEAPNYTLGEDERERS